MAIAARVKEWFLLKQAAEEAKGRPASAREAVAEGLALGRQRADAAEALWSNGHAAEGLRLAVDALECTLGAAEALGVGGPVKKTPVAAIAEALDDADEPDSETDSEADAEADAGAEPEADSEADSDSEAEAEVEAEAEAEPDAFADWKTVLRARGLDAERLERVKMSKASLSEAALPALDGAVSAAHAELYKDVSRGRQDVDRVLSSASMTLGQIRWRRMQRWATTATVIAACLVGTWLMVRTPHRVFSTASAFYRNDAQFSPDNVFDGDEHTEWLLNDRQTGWVEGRLSPARSISAVRILNGHNRHYNDRAVKGYKIELFDSSGNKLTEIEGEFERLAPAPEWVSHPAEFDDVERIRISVTSSHRLGASLAEVAWDEK